MSSTWYPLSQLEVDIRRHWQRYRPRLFQQLQEKEDLERAINEAAQRTRAAYQEGVAKGLDSQSAWEAIREEWAFLPAEEGEERAEDDEEALAFWSHWLGGTDEDEDPPDDFSEGRGA